MKKELTAQQIFNKVALHLAKQGKKALNKEGSPVLRTKDGLCCAYGCLMPKTIECDRPMVSGMSLIFKAQGINEGKHLKLLSTLMRLHDEEKVSRWGQKLRALAKKEGLKVPEWLRLAK